MEKDIKIYGNIYEMFQPIFDWLSYHYPSDDATFVIDKSGAVMYINHGPVICNEKEWNKIKEVFAHEVGNNEAFGDQAIQEQPAKE